MKKKSSKISSMFSGKDKSSGSIKIDNQRIQSGKPSRRIINTQTMLSPG